MTENNKSSHATGLAAPVRFIWDPVRHFILTENASGIILLIATIAALIWANVSPESYNGFWEIKAKFEVERFSMNLSLREWVNDALMTIFFLLVGLEIKREMLVGELSSFRQAILPVVAAAGGMLVPALIYTGIAGGTEVARGWGIPVATDIAFALGVLTMVGKCVPSSLKIFLAALAIADDLGAVLVIALFYGTQLNTTALIVAGAIFFMLLISNKMGIRSAIWYGAWGLILWISVCFSGIHSTIAGVLLAITIPSWSRIDLNRFRKTIDTISNYLNKREHPENGILSDMRLLGNVAVLNGSVQNIQPLMFTIEHNLGPWVSMIIMPLFALSNAGVPIANVGFSIIHDPLAQGIAAGLVFGKPIGIVLGTWIVIKLGFASLPTKATWKHLWGMGMLGGIGFTMSLFVAGLAVGEGAHLDTARLAILCSSTLAGTAGFLYLKMLPPVDQAVPATAAAKEDKRDTASSEESAAESGQPAPKDNSAAADVK